jgi:hypothetical protein
LLLKEMLPIIYNKNTLLCFNQNVLAFCHCNEILEMTNLKEKRFLLAHGFGGSSED